MNLMNPRLWFRMVTVALLVMGCAGCAYKVVRPLPLVVEASERSVAHTVNYPAYVVVHDSSSFWDAHQIKDNVFGLTQGEVVHWVDHVLDLASPGPRRRPWAHGIEWIKNSYAQLPDRAPVRIVGGLFSALRIEKTTVLSVPKIVAAPTDPMTYLAFFQADERGGRPFETWTGTLGISPTTITVHRIDPSHASRAGKAPHSPNLGGRPARASHTGITEK